MDGSRAGATTTLGLQNLLPSLPGVTSTSVLPGITGIATTAAQLCLSFPREKPQMGGDLEGCSPAAVLSPREEAVSVPGWSGCWVLPTAGSLRGLAPLPIQRVLQLDWAGSRSNLHQRSIASVSSAEGEASGRAPSAASLRRRRRRRRAKFCLKLCK